MTSSLAWASPASADAGPAPTNLNATATMSTVRTGSQDSLVATLTMSGATSDAPAAAVANEIVTFATQQPDGTWAVAGTAITDSEGAATLSIPVTAGAVPYHAFFGGDATYAASQSPTFVLNGVDAQTTMTINAPPTDTDGSTVGFGATWAFADPAVASGPVVGGAVQVLTRGSTHDTWTVFAMLRTDASGQVRWKAAPLRNSYWEVVGIASDGTQSATSPTAFVREVPGARVWTLPRNLPHPSPLVAQQRAVGDGANPVVTQIPNAVWKQMVGVSWHPGCPVSRPSLRLINVNYYGFDGYRHRGQLVVNARAVRDFVGAFRALYRAKVPFHGMYIVDRFGYSRITAGADDYASMQHDNTSAFDCRWVDGSPGVLSPHASGLSVDLDPFENPYDSRLGWTPNFVWPGHSIGIYAWRTPNALVVRIMKAHGFNWTYGIHDSQHFDAVRGLT